MFKPMPTLESLAAEMRNLQEHFEDITDLISAYPLAADPPTS
jgi:hypothetical protein